MKHASQNANRGIFCFQSPRRHQKNGGDAPSAFGDRGVINS